MNGSPGFSDQSPSNGPQAHVFTRESKRVGPLGRQGGWDASESDGKTKTGNINVDRGKTEDRGVSEQYKGISEQREKGCLPKGGIG